METGDGRLQATNGNRPICNLQFAIPLRRLCLYGVLHACVWFPALRAQDDVVHRRNGIIDRGTIIAQDASGIRMLRADARREIRIPQEQIESVQVKLTEQQQQGDKLLEERRYLAAAQKLEEAFKVESRDWLRSHIASNLVACYVAAGDSVAAIQSFFTTAQSTDSHISVSTVPLWWLPEPPPGPVLQYAANLLQANGPMEQVIGASYLFGTAHSATARNTLARLTTYRDERLAQLARAQLWRWETAAITLEEVESWQRQVTRLPSDMRGGPYFAIGLALQRIGRHEDAAMAYLWPALVYRNDPKLSSRAGLLAADCLEQAGQMAEAKQLYSEVVSRFAPSLDATAAQKRLDALNE